MVYKWLKISLSRFRLWLFPPTCVFTGLPSGQSIDILSSIDEKLPYIEYACDICGLEVNQSNSSVDGRVICGNCIRKPPFFDQTLSLFKYQEPISWLIQDLKFNGRLHYARLLGEIFYERYSRRTITKPELLMPVPLHAKRLRQRGFNQALEIAKPIAKLANIDLDYRSCIRTSDTPQQTDLPASKRAANVRNAFSIEFDLNVEHVAIIDDVITTGATVNEMAKKLKRSGVKKVEVWSIARTHFNEI